MIKILLKEKNIKIEVKRVFFVFSPWFFYYYWVSSGKFSIWLNKEKKDKHVYNFMRYMWGFLTSKNALLMRRWKCHHVLFHMEQHMSTLVVWFVVGESFFSSSFLFSHLKIIVWPSLLLIFQFQSLFFWFIFFVFDPFVKVLFVFNFILQSQFTKNYIFQFDSYSFDFFFFSLVLL